MDPVQVTVIYADTSAIVRAYMPDEPEHPALRAMLLESDGMITSEIARLEFVSAVRGAFRSGRLREPTAFIRRFELDAAVNGPIELVEFERDVLLPTAYRLLNEQPLRALDAVHLATALDLMTAVYGENVVFVTRDEAQATAARALGLDVQ